LSGSSAWTIAPVINFLIETFGKRGHRTREAQALTDGRARGLMTSRGKCEEGLRDGLMNLWAAQHRLALMQQRLDLQEQLVKLLEHRFTVGAASHWTSRASDRNRNQISLAFRDAERQGVPRGRSWPRPSGFAGCSGWDRLVFRRVRSTGAGRVPMSVPASCGGQPGSIGATCRLSWPNMLPRSRLLRCRLLINTPTSRECGYGYDSGQHKYMLMPAADLLGFQPKSGADRRNTR